MFAPHRVRALHIAILRRENPYPEHVTVTLTFFCLRFQAKPSRRIRRAHIHARANLLIPPHSLPNQSTVQTKLHSRPLRYPWLPKNTLCNQDRLSNQIANHRQINPIPLLLPPPNMAQVALNLAPALAPSLSQVSRPLIAELGALLRTGRVGRLTSVSSTTSLTD